VPEDPIGDPEALRWVEAGVSGLARRREWDAVELVLLPELADLPLEEFRFALLADGTLVPADGAAVPEAVLERLADRIRAALAPPFDAVAARHTREEWSVAARALRIDELELPQVDATEIVVALGPEGSATLLVDGEEEGAPASAVAAAARELERVGSERYDSFVVRARRVAGDRFAVSVDPL
jgi:hypothetical protein